MRFIFGLICLFFASFLQAQGRAVTGWIFDKVTLETIPSAIVINDTSEVYATSNSSGYFQILSKQGRQKLIFAAPGYRPEVIYIDVFGVENKNIFLEPVYFDQMDSTEEFTSLRTSKTSYYKPLNRQLVQSKTIFSISDPVKLLQFIPGVMGGFEGLSSNYVRGSNSDQNLSLMNGLPLYGNGHVWGLLSNYNPDIIKSTEFYRGIAPARYGNRGGGGVLDVITSGGNAEDWNGNVNIDMATASINIDGPLDKKGKLTTSLGIRRSYWDLVLTSLIPSLNDFLVGNIHDINWKIDYKQNSKTHYDFWVYNGRDKYGVGLGDTYVDSLGRVTRLDLNFGWQWQNTLSGFNISHVLSKRHFVKAGIGISRYAYKSYTALGFSSAIDTQANNLSEYKTTSSITDYNAFADFDYLMGEKTSFKYGTHWVTHSMVPGEFRVYEKITGSPIYDTTYGSQNNVWVSEWSNYGELEFHPSQFLNINLGARLWTYLSSHNTFIRIEPRLTLSQMLQGKKRIQIGLSMNNQGIHQLSSVTGILPQDIWFPSTGNIKPQQTTQVSAAYLQPLGNGFELSVEGYYKYLDGVFEVREGDDELSSRYWENFSSQGVGNSRGIEILISKRSGELNMIGSYTFSKTTRQFDNLNGGEEFSFRWDRTHRLALQLVYQASESLLFNLNGVLMSGNPVTVPTGRYFTTDNRLVYDYSSVNNYRLPTYFRIDVGYTKEIQPDSRRESREFYGVNIYNVMGKHNPMVASFNTNSVNDLKLIGLSYFSFVPSAFYRIEF